MTDNTREVLVASCFTMMGLCFVAVMANAGKPMIEEKVVVAEGVFEGVEYTAPSKWSYSNASTIIYFVDGSNYVIRYNHVSVPFAKNTRIKIVKTFVH